MITFGCPPSIFRLLLPVLAPTTSLDKHLIYLSEERKASNPGIDLEISDYQSDEAPRLRGAMCTSIRMNWQYVCAASCL